MQQATIEYRSSDYVELKLYESEDLTDPTQIKKICGSQDDGWDLIDDAEFEEPEWLEFYPDFNDVVKTTLKVLPEVKHFVVCINSDQVYEGTLPHFKLID